MSHSIEVAIAKTHKYASRDSGDTAEVVERPNGGLSLVVVDGQGSGRGARVISQLIVARVVALLKEGVRDGAVSRAASDILIAHRHGQVSATLDMVSVDLPAGEVVVTRQGGTQGAVRHLEGVDLLVSAPPPLGRYPLSRPTIWRYPIATGLLVVVTSDGITGSGQRQGQEALDLAAFLEELPDGASAQEIADGLLTCALERDNGKPADDCTVGVVLIGDNADERVIRRMSVSLPVL